MMQSVTPLGPSMPSGPSRSSQNPLSRLGLRTRCEQRARDIRSISQQYVDGYVAEGGSGWKNGRGRRKARAVERPSVDTHNHINQWSGRNLIFVCACRQKRRLGSVKNGDVILYKQSHKFLPKWGKQEAHGSRRRSFYGNW